VKPLKRVFSSKDSWLIVFTIFSILFAYYLISFRNKQPDQDSSRKQEAVGLTPNTGNPTRPPELQTPEKEETVTIAIGGDVMLDRYIRQMAQTQGYEFIVEKISPYFKDSDFALVDLEGPITDNKSISIYSKIGSRENYVFTFAPESINAIKSMGIDLVSIGNNHILNQGADGLESTRNFLNNEKIPCIGDPQKLGQTYTTEIKGIKFGFINFNEFDGNSDGVETTNVKIKELKKQGVDYLVVIPHWGVEYNTYANEHYQQIAHEFIDSGAQAVVGSHPHVIQQNELYKNNPIFYSLGNLVMDQYFEENVKNGLIVKLKVKSTDLSTEIETIKTKLDLSGQTQIIK
jgi:poly-gamma-glutamate synthesis protein (capsule biosynthesis protein)